MESLAKNISSLLRDPKYSDLKIQCEGRTYYVHRAIVCSASLVFERECDGGYKESADGVIVHTMFDVLTLERMLQFMYEGDYTVKAITHEVKERIHPTESTGFNVEERKCIPPHLRNKTATTRSCEEMQIVQTKAPAPNATTAHVLVYAIAEYYELPELKALAAEKFKTTNETLGIDDFLQLAKVIYWNTRTAEDDLRKELLLMLMTNSEWLLEEHFTAALANDLELHEFTVAVMSALSEQLSQKLAQDEVDTEQQETRTSLLQSDLDQANEDLARSSQRSRVLEARVSQLEDDVQSSRSEIAKLEEELKVSCDWGHKHSEQSDEIRKQMNETREKLEAETARANKNRDIRMQQDETIKQKNAKIQAETERANKNFDICKQLRIKIEAETCRANKNYDLCNKKDEIIKENDLTITAEKEKAERATAIIKSVVSNVNSLAECDGYGCGAELNFKLKKDDRSGGYPFNAMLCCLFCNRRVYGDYVE